MKLIDKTSLILGITIFLNSQLSAAVNFQDPPLTIHPSSAVADGATITLTGNLNVDSGSALYQWFKDGVLLANGRGLAGATTSRLTIKPAKKTDTGNYQLRVREIIVGGGVADPVFSNLSAGAITVNVRPILTTHPLSQTLEQDTELTLTVGVSAESEQSLTYEWQRNNIPIDPVAHPSAREKDFIILARDPLDPVARPGVQQINAGSYRVRVSNASGISVFSRPCVISVNSAATIITDPPPTHFIASKTTGKIAVVAGGTPRLTYQWEIEGEGNVTRGGNAASISIPGVPASNGKRYRVTVRNSRNNEDTRPPATSTWSEIRVINRLSSPNVTAQLEATRYDKGSAVLNAGTTPEITVHPSMENTGTLQYTWQKDGKNIVANADVNGINQQTLVFTNLKWTDRGVYRCIVRNEVGVTTSKTFRLEVNSAPVILVHPQPSVAGLTGGSASLTVVAGGTGRLSYQWFANDVAVEKATRNKLSASKLVRSFPGSVSYRCEIRNSWSDVLKGGDPEISNESLMTVYDPVKITTHPQAPPNGIRFNTDSNLFVEVSGDAPIFEWYLGRQRLTNGPVGSATVSGADSNRLEINQIQTGFQGSYTCVVRNAPIPGSSKFLANATSRQARINVIMPTSIVRDTQSTPSSPVIEDTRVVLSVVGGGTPPLTYQWQKSVSATGPWSPIPKATKSELVFTSIQLEDKDFYRCVINNRANETAESTALELEVESAPPASITRFVPRTARTGERIRVTGSDLRYIRSAKIGTSSVSSFVIEEDSNILLTVPASAPLASVGTDLRRIEVSTKRFTTQSPNPFARTVNFSNNAKFDATILTGATVLIQGDTTGFTNREGARPNQLDLVSTAWYWWKCPRDGFYKIQVDTTQFDTVMNLYAGDPGTDDPLTFVAALDTPGGSAENRNYSIGEGVDVVIVVGGKESQALPSTGKFQLSILVSSISPLNPPDDSEHNLPLMAAESGEVWVSESPSSITIGSQSEANDTSDSLILDSVVSNLPEDGNVVFTSFDMTYSKAVSSSGLDDFGWILYSTDDEIIGGVWLNAELGTISVMQADGKYKSLDHMLLGGEFHHLDFIVDRKNKLWSAYLDGVLMSESNGIPAGKLFKEVSPFWKSKGENNESTMTIINHSVRVID